MKLLKVKIERIIALLYLFIAIANIIKTNINFLIASVVMQALIIAGFYYIIRETRNELLRSIEAGTIKQLKTSIKKAIALFIKEAITNKLEDTKKEVIGSNLKTTKLKDAF